MATNFVQDGNTLTKTVTGTVSAGDPTVTGSIFGVWLNDYTSGEEGLVATGGVWQLTKLVSGAFTQGQDLYWDGSAMVANATGPLLRAGVAWAAAASGTTSVNVKINAPNQKAVAAV